jgi:hypothetical protein
VFALHSSRFGWPKFAAQLAAVSIILANASHRNEFLHTAYNLINMPLFSSR